MKNKVTSLSTAGPQCVHESVWQTWASHRVLEGHEAVADPAARRSRLCRCRRRHARSYDPAHRRKPSLSSGPEWDPGNKTDKIHIIPTKQCISVQSYIHSSVVMLDSKWEKRWKLRQNPNLKESLGQKLRKCFIISFIMCTTFIL